MSKDYETRLVLVAPVVPDEPAYRNIAFSRAGNMYITNVVKSLVGAGMAPIEVISFQPIPSFPTGPRLRVRGETRRMGEVPLRLLPFVNLPVVKQAMIAIGVFARLMALRIRTRGPVAVYTYNVGLPHGPAVLLAARIMRLSAIASLNDVIEPGQMAPNSLRWRANHWLEKQLIPRFNGHISVADATMKDLAPGRNYFRLEGGVSPGVFEGTSTKKEPRDDMFTVVVAGGLDRANGIIEILDAFQMLRGSMYRFIVAGEGPLAAKVREAATRDPRIAYLGQLDFDAVLKLYSAADVLINMRLTSSVSTRYFYPSKMMEYLASGVPVISTCTGHTEAEFGEFVYLLRDESAQGLAALLETVAATPYRERARKGQAAREYMERFKTWGHLGKQLAAYIESIGASRGKTSDSAPLS